MELRGEIIHHERPVDLANSTRPELDSSIVNINGDAIAMGPSVGLHQRRIIGSLAHELYRRGGGWSLAAICIG